MSNMREGAAMTGGLDEESEIVQWCTGLIKLSW